MNRIWKTMAGLLAVAGALMAAGAASAAQPEPWQMGLQAPATPSMEELVWFHDLLLYIIIVISVIVLALLLYVVWRFSEKRNPTPSTTSHNTLIEVLWTVIPVIILVAIAVPSFRILYFLDRAADPDMTIQVTAHQWYWSYSYPDHDDISITSVLDRSEEVPDNLRLLQTNNALILPTDTTIRFLVTSQDVLHSFAMPAFGVKTDAIKGRNNETWALINEPGTYYGQCSEICGRDHAYMPIEIRAVTPEEFEAWVAEELAARDGEPGDVPGEGSATDLAALDD